MNKGYLVLEYLLWFLAAILVLIVLTNVLSVTKNIDIHDEYLQDEIRLCQLERELLLAENFAIFSDELHFVKGDKNKSLYYTNNRLIMGPGTIIVLEDIEWANFEIIDNMVVLHYKRNNDLFERVVYEE